MIKAVQDDCHVRAIVSAEVRESATWRCGGDLQ